MNFQSLAPNAFIPLADYRQFSAGRRWSSSHVQSRLLLWCVSGRGALRVNRKAFDLNPGRFLIMPWDRSIVFEADEDDPLMVGAVHVIPDASPAGRQEYAVYRAGAEQPPGTASRGDIPLPGLEEVFSEDFSRFPELRSLAEYIVAWYLRPPRDEWMARQLARIFIAELVRTATSREAARNTLPVALQRMLSYIDDNLEKKLTIRMLAQAGRCSTATVSRLFRRHLQVPAARWVFTRRMKTAARLLATTQLRVAEIGRQVGIDDPYYFSKQFRKAHGITATEHRRASFA